MPTPDDRAPSAPAPGERVRIPLDELAEYLHANRLVIVRSEWPPAAPAPIVYLAPLDRASLDRAHTEGDSRHD